MTILPGAGAYWFEGNDIGCLLVHGFTGTPQNVRPLADYLARRGLAVSAPRMPGHGTVVADLDATGPEDWLGAAEDALAEMRRVLKPGGRLLVTVWQSLERAPMFTALNTATLRLVGLPVYSAPFVLGEPGVLESLLTEAGFERVDVSEQTREIWFATPEHFVARNLQASAAAIPVLTAMSETERADLARRMQADMGAMLTESVKGGMLVTQLSGWIGQAWR